MLVAKDSISIILVDSRPGLTQKASSKDLPCFYIFDAALCILEHRNYKRLEWALIARNIEGQIEAGGN
jgi:hypothetical protein